MLNGSIAALLMVVSLAAAAVPASAQDGQRPAGRGQTSGAVSEAGPVYLLPDATRTPLRTLPVGTIVSIGQIKGDWIQVTFNDGVLGSRTGWMERRFLTIGPTKEAPEPGTPRSTTPPPAQTRPRPLPPRRAVEPPAGRAFGSVMFDRMAASESFNAVTGKDRVLSYGGGIQGVNLWRGLFVEASIELGKVDGERVFVLDDEVFPLGIPLEIEMMPIDVVGGWRQKVANRVYAYGGGGVTFLTYKETSEFADEDDNVDERYTGFVVMGGVEVGLARWVHARGEVRFRSVNDVLGVGGVSEAFDETTFGGVGFGLKIVVGR